MKRKDFIKKSAVLGAIGLSSPLILKANPQKKISTYDRLKDQIGFNHIPIVRGDFFLWINFQY